MTETEYAKLALKDSEIIKPEETVVYGYGVRHVQSFLFFICLALGYMARAHLGVTVVAMIDNPTKTNTDSTNIIQENTTISLAAIVGEEQYNNENITKLSVNSTIWNDEQVVRAENFNYTKDNFKIEQSININNNTSIWNVYKNYDWPKSTQEMVLGAFFVGYSIMMFPMGLVCQRWGGKIPLQISLFVNGVVSIAVPWLTAWGGWMAICICRVLQGISQAGIYPSIHTLLANWVPASERGSLSSYVYTGSIFGTVVAFQLGGLLADSPWGWPSTFWLTGLMCLIGFTLLSVFGSSKPSEHRSISPEERNFILGHREDDKKKNTKTPWKKIVNSRPVWACISAHIGSGVSYVFLFTQVPTYMHAILQFNIKSSGLLSSLPYIMGLLGTVTIGYLSDFFTNRNILSIKQARIISNSISSVGASLCISAVSYIHNSTLAVILFILTLTCHTTCHTGFMVNYIDLAPNYSGALMAFGNTLCNCMVVLLPVAVSSVVTDVSNYHQWQIMFLLIAGLLLASNAVYVFFTSADVEEWNDSNKIIDDEEIKLAERQ